MGQTNWKEKIKREIEDPLNTLLHGLNYSKVYVNNVNDLLEDIQWAIKTVRDPVSVKVSEQERKSLLVRLNDLYRKCENYGMQMAGEQFHPNERHDRPNEVIGEDYYSSLDSKINKKEMEHLHREHQARPSAFPYGHRRVISHMPIPVNLQSDPQFSQLQKEGRLGDAANRAEDLGFYAIAHAMRQNENDAPIGDVGLMGNSKSLETVERLVRANADIEIIADAMEDDGYPRANVLRDFARRNSVNKNSDYVRKHPLITWHEPRSIVEDYKRWIATRDSSNPKTPQSCLALLGHLGRIQRDKYYLLHIAEEAQQAGFPRYMELKQIIEMWDRSKGSWDYEAGWNDVLIYLGDLKKWAQNACRGKSMDGFLSKNFKLPKVRRGILHSR